MKNENDAKPEKQQSEPENNLSLIMKCRDSMMEVLRLTGETLKLNKEIAELEEDIERYEKILDYIIAAPPRGQ
ncbi:MAG: hypothetical protein IPP35_07905 [Elusimicrobia bacterium]|nr:hypothetical protein [Elusimicrobiota bacterium]